MGQDFVDQTDLGGQLVLVDVESQMAADEAYGPVSPLEGPRRRGEEGKGSIPRPPIIKTAGFWSAMMKPIAPRDSGEKGKGRKGGEEGKD